jgi:hypothetical protein
LCRELQKTTACTGAAPTSGDHDGCVDDHSHQATWYTMYRICTVRQSRSIARAAPAAPYAS